LLKDSSLLKIHFGISGDFFTYFLLQYFQRTCSGFTDCKDSDFIFIRNNLSSQRTHFVRELISVFFGTLLFLKADAKIGFLIFDLQMFYRFFCKKISSS